MVITLCGSTKYKKDFEEANKKLSMEGHVVFSLPVFSKADNDELSIADVNILKGVHFKKIDMSDAVVIINVDGYIGLSTMDEIFYAIAKGKQLLFWKPLTDDERKDIIDKLSRLLANKLSYDCKFREPDKEN